MNLSIPCIKSSQTTRNKFLFKICIALMQTQIHATQPLKVKLSKFLEELLLRLFKYE